MHIIALVKQTPDTAKLSKTVGGMQLLADGQPRIVNPWDEYAIEVALQLKEKHGGRKVTVLTLGKPESVEALRTALAMGVDEAVHICDPLLNEADTLTTARALAAAIGKLGGADVIVAGRSAIDGGDGATAVQVATLLDLPMLGYVAQLHGIANRRISVTRAMEYGRETVSAELPVVMSVLKEIAEPRYPTFMGIRKAAKATITTWTLAGLELHPVAPALTWVAAPPAQRESQIEWLQGTPAEMATALVDRLFAAKAL